VIALAILALAGPAAAAPQILGLVASAAPVPLTCAAGECAAAFPAFCLQRERTMPRQDAAYRAAEGTVLTLTFTGPDGMRRALPISRTATIAAHRGYYAVRIAIPASVIGGYGGSDPAIAIAPLASVVPIAQPGHRRQLDKAEIAHVTGPHRKAVARALAANGDATLAVATLSRLINVLPEGWTSAENRRTLWRRVIGAAPTPAAHAGLRQANDAYGFCKRWADIGGGDGDGMRDCLQELHDHSGDVITNKAWQAAQPGS